MVDNRENNIWTVYIHIIPKEISNYDYDKYYVGITSKSVEFRWKKDGYGYISQPFYNAIQKYGWDNIEHYIIAEHLTEYEAKEFEKALIQKLDCNINKGKHGYNYTDGGDGMLGYVMPDKEKERRRTIYSGKDNPFYGKKHSEETRELMKKNHADFSGGNHPESRIIHQFNIDGSFIKTYPSINDAAKELGVTDSIHKGAKFHRKSVGYLWAYDEDVSIIDGIPHMKYKYIEKPPKHYKHIYMFDKNKQLINDYISGGEAGRDNNIQRNMITNAARLKGTCKGYYWRYEKDVGFTEEGKAYFIA